MGGNSFGIKTLAIDDYNNFKNSYTCTGGEWSGSYIQYICTTQTPNAQNALIHNSAKNILGGQGGSGGGIISSSSKQGKGSDGGDGYIRIRW